MAKLTTATAPARLRASLTVPVGVAAAFLALYATRIDRWVGMADTAKFQLIGAHLGTPHAPGYPTYVLLLHLLIHLLPPLTWAAVADGFSALCLAATVGLVARLAWALGAGWLPALAAAVAFGSLPAVRGVASAAEVYPLQLLLIAGAGLAMLQWRDRGQLSQLVTGCALLSLALSHHPTVVCSFPAMLLLAAGRWPSFRRLAAWTPLFLFLAVAPFSYIVWRSYAPVSSHVEMQAHSAAQLWNGLSGAQHRANLLRLGWTGIFQQRLPWLAAQLWRQEGWLLAVALAGLLAGRRRLGAAFAALLALGSAAFTLVYTVPDLDVYLLPTHLAAAVALALGTQRLVERLPGALGGALCLAVAISPALLGPWLPRQTDAPWGREMAAIVDAVPGDDVIVSFDYPASMALLYTAWERHGGRPRVAAIPEVGLVAPIATNHLRRHLLGGAPFRLGPRDELVAPGTPLVCRCPDASTRAALARQGILADPVLRRGLFRLRATPTRPTLPAAILVHRLVTVTSLRAEIEAVTAPSFAPAQTAIRLGRSSSEVWRPPGGGASVREVSPDALVADVASPGGGWVVLTDVYASRWTVTVDGRPADSFRADVLFPGLAIAPGSHRLEVIRDRRPFSLARWWRGSWGYLLL